MFAPRPLFVTPVGLDPGAVVGAGAGVGAAAVWRTLRKGLRRGGERGVLRARGRRLVLPVPVPVRVPLVLAPGAVPETVAVTVAVLALGELAAVFFARSIPIPGAAKPGPGVGTRVWTDLKTCTVGDESTLPFSLEF